MLRLGRGGRGQQPLDKPGTVEMGYLDGGTDFVRQVHHRRLPAPGQVGGQGKHMGEDGVGLPLSQIGAQRFGIAQGGHRMVKALVARVGGPVGGIVEVQVVEQARPGGGPLVPAKARARRKAV